MLTDRENYLYFITGQPEKCDHVPCMDLFGMVGPSILYKDRNPDMSGFDFYGVEYITSPEITGGFIPVPNKFLLEDICDWRDVVKNPDLSGVDWEQMAKEDLAKIDGVNHPVCANFIPGFFQCLINFMGFNEGLMAIAEEPEEVKALMEYITDFYVEVAEKMIEYYKPDMMWLPDDVCTQRGPFISAEAYEELFLPSILRYAKVFLDAGIPVEYHCCGECTEFIDYWVEAGIPAWDPGQVMNDLHAIHAKYGNRLAIFGGWDSSSGKLNRDDVTDEEIIQAVHDWCDEYLSEGLYGFAGSFVGDMTDPAMQHKMGVMYGELAQYSAKFFAK